MMKRLIAIGLIVCVFLSVCLTGCSSLEEQPPGDPGKTDYINRDIAYSNENIFSDFIAVANEEINEFDSYFLGETDVWLDKIGQVEIVNLYYYNEQSKYEMIKTHFVVDGSNAMLEYISYYEDSEYDFKNADKNILNENVILESCAEVREYVLDNNRDEYFIKIYSDEDMYVMGMEGYEGNKYRLMELDEKINGLWKTSFERDKDSGNISKPMPEKN